MQHLLSLRIFTKIQSLRSASLTAAKRRFDRLLNDVRCGEPGFWTDDCSNAGQPVQPGGNIIAMLLINLRLGLVSNLIVPLMIFTTGFFARWAETISRHS